MKCRNRLSNLSQYKWEACTNERGSPQLPDQMLFRTVMYSYSTVPLQAAGESRGHGDVSISKQGVEKCTSLHKLVRSQKTSLTSQGCSAGCKSWSHSFGFSSDGSASKAFLLVIPREITTSRAHAYASLARWLYLLRPSSRVERYRESEFPPGLHLLKIPLVTV